MNVLFVGRSIAHFTYYDSIIRQLCANGHRVHLIYDREWSNFDFGPVIKAALNEIPNLSVGWTQRRRGRMRRVIFGLRELRSFAGYARRTTQSEFYLKRWQGYLPPRVRMWLDRGAVRAAVSSWPVRTVLRWLEDLLPSAPNIIAELRMWQPDVLVASPVNMRFSEEVEYVKAARALGIPTALPVLSWDNLTTKGLVNIRPDLFLAWNNAHRKEAIEIHGAAEREVAVIGSPFFDKWFERHSLQDDRTAFFRKVGFADEVRPMIAYLGSSKNIAKDESWLVQEIYERLKQHSDPLVRNAYMLVRPHPANADVYRKLHGEDLVVWPRAGQLPEELEAQKDFINSLKHAACVIGINTSGMIDAVIHDVPCISVITDQYESTQSQAEHFRHLLTADVLELPVGTAQAVETIQRLLRGDDRNAAQRQKFVKEFIRPFGAARSAGRAAAEEIEALAARRAARWSSAGRRQTIAGK